ncbi:MAG: hypothetical protein LBU76_04350 [Azoarcus sp.]|nr:hypothetical protein [Azoarcus sp.]
MLAEVSVSLRKILPVVVGSVMLLVVSFVGDKLNRAAVVSPEQATGELRFSPAAAGRLNKVFAEKATVHGNVGCLPEDCSPTKRLEFARTLVERGDDLKQHGMLDDAVAAYDDVASLFGIDDSPCVQAEVLRALVGKSFVLKQQGRLKKDDAVCREIDRRGGMDSSPVKEYLTGENKRRSLGAILHRTRN